MKIPKKNNARVRCEKIHEARLEKGSRGKKRIQANRSHKVAVKTILRPVGFPNSPTSSKILRITGTADTDIATAKISAVRICEPPLGLGKRSGMAKTRIKPKIKGGKKAPI